jgi:two-component system response regulator AtoC
MKILIADDDKNLRMVLKNELADAGFDISEASNGKKTIDMLKKDEYDVLILDLNMPGLNGIDVLKKIKKVDIATETIILTAHATVSTAVEAMKLGAYDFITKPFQMDELIVTIEKAFEKKSLIRENLILKSQIKRQSTAQGIITKSPRMLELLETIKKASSADLPILISGESGVGKELIAKTVHSSSNRPDGPFIPINCGAIPETMLESELFGHEKGAFTGAHAQKLGLLEIANRGTLFLDEIAELTTQLQGKLLRAIETGTFFRVGGVREISVDVRFVSATNKDIKKEVEAGTFRSDLYYRISALTFHIPPLKERREDIPLLVEHIISKNTNFKDKKISKKAIKVLSEYEWPGNVRELQNIMHRALFLATRAVIEPADLPFDMISTYKMSGARLEDIEREHILRVLKEAGGQRGRAAEILDVNPKTLYRKLASYGITE